MSTYLKEQIMSQLWAHWVCDAQGPQNMRLLAQEDKRCPKTQKSQ